MSEWKECKLGDIVTFQRGFDITKKEQVHGELFDVGSSNPTLNRNHIHLLATSLPPLPEQRVIDSVLSSLDDKINLLHRQNKTLETMAETLFRQWFVEGADEGWKERPLSSYGTIICGKTPSRKYKIISMGISHLSILTTR